MREAMIKRALLTRLTRCRVLLIMLLVLGSGVVADARQNQNDIEYWRTHYQELKPADDPRVSRAQTIFQRLIQVTGRRPDVEPRLFIIQRDPWHLTLPIALPKGWIVLSKGVLDICYREPAMGDDRLAFILAHEISHQLSGDLWHLRFFQAVESVSRHQAAPPDFLKDLQRGVSMTEHVLARELQADERGVIYAAMAGFETQAIVTADDSVNFFADWVGALNPGRLSDLSSPQPRPTPQERATALQTRLRQVVDQTAVFQAGLWWYDAGDYPRAIQAFEHFRGLYPGREVIHNLAASHHRLALQLYQAWQPDKPALPFQVSMAIDPETRASTIYLDAWTQSARGQQAKADAARLFRQHLDQAITHYREARQLDASYLPTALNLSSALMLRSVHARETSRQGDLAETIMTLARVLEGRSRDADILTNLGVAYFYEGQRERAKTYLHQARTLAPDDAAPVYNLAHLAHIEQRQGEAQRYRRIYEQLATHLDSKPRTVPASIEYIQHLTIGDVLPMQWQTRLQSRFELDGRAYTLTTYPTSITTLTQDREILMVMALPGYRGQSANGIKLGSQAREVLTAYGAPSRRLATTQGYTWSYDQHGLAFQFKQERVVSWLIF